MRIFWGRMTKKDISIIVICFLQTVLVVFISFFLYEKYYLIKPPLKSVINCVDNKIVELSFSERKENKGQEFENMMLALIPAAVDECEPVINRMIQDMVKESKADITDQDFSNLKKMYKDMVIDSYTKDV